MSVLIIFICLLRKFNELSEDYQQEQRGQGNFVRVAKCLAVFICLLYLFNTLLFDVIAPLIWHFHMGDNTSSSVYRDTLLYINFAMSLADFISCMAILYLIH